MLRHSRLTDKRFDCMQARNRIFYDCGCSRQVAYSRLRHQRHYQPQQQKHQWEQNSFMILLDDMVWAWEREMECRYSFNDRSQCITNLVWWLTMKFVYGKGLTLLISSDSTNVERMSVLREWTYPDFYFFPRRFLFFPQRFLIFFSTKSGHKRFFFCICGRALFRAIYLKDMKIQA